MATARSHPPYDQTASPHRVPLVDTPIPHAGARKAGPSFTPTTRPGPRTRGQVRHQHHAAHRRDAGAAHHLHGGDAARPEGARHRAAPAATAQQPQQTTSRRTRWCWAWRSRPPAPSSASTRARWPTWRSWTSGSRTSSRPSSDKTMFVRASGKVPYGKVVEAMDVAKGAGVERIGIISEKMIEEAGGQGSAVPFGLSIRSATGARPEPAVFLAPPSGRRTPGDRWPRRSEHARPPREVRSTAAPSPRW